MSELPENQQTKTRDPAAQFWLTKATNVKRKINLSLWFDIFLKPFCCLVAISSIALLFERRISGQMYYSWIFFLLLTIIWTAYCLLITRAQAFTNSQALSWLDSALKLNNRLSTAKAGICQWPNATANSEHNNLAQLDDDGLSWNYNAVAWPMLLSLTILIFAAFIPIAKDQVKATTGPEKPLSWEQVEQALETLELAQVVEQQALSEFQQRLNELLLQDPQKWYSHGSLEASEELHSQLDHGLSQMEQNLGKTQSAFSALEESAESGESSASNSASQEIAGALNKLESGQIPLDNELANQLKQLDANSLAKLSPEEREKLRESLRNGQSIIKDAKRKLSPDQGKQQGSAKNDSTTEGDTPCQSEGENQFCQSSPQSSSRTIGPEQRPGQPGGISRGPGTAPLELDPKPGLGGLDSIEVIHSPDLPEENQDYSTVYSSDAPEVDRNSSHQLKPSGSAANQEGKSSSAWKQSYTPDEQNLLQRFFK